MFFLGILLSVEALSAAGLLQLLAAELSQAVPDVSIIAAAIGVASAVIDNVSAPCGRRVQDVLVSGAHSIVLRAVAHTHAGQSVAAGSCAAGLCAAQLDSARGPVRCRTVQ